MNPVIAAAPDSPMAVHTRHLLDAPIVPTLLRLAAGDPFDLEELRDRPDAHRPFDHPYFWGAFICQGVSAPLGSS